MLARCGTNLAFVDAVAGPQLRTESLGVYAGLQMPPGTTACFDRQLASVDLRLVTLAAVARPVTRKASAVRISEHKCSPSMLTSVDCGLAFVDAPKQVAI